MTQFTCKYNISDYFLLNFEFFAPKLAVVFVVANGKDDSPIKDAAIVIDPSKTVTTDENGNHVEEHCEALNNKEFGIKKDDFCDAKVTVEKLEGAKDFKWALMHPKTSKFLNFCNFRHFGTNQFFVF